MLNLFLKVVQTLYIPKMNSLNDLQNMTLTELIIKSESPDFENLLASMGLLHVSMPCHRCGKKMAVDLHGNSKRWRCNARPCRDQSPIIKQGFYVGTYFESSALPIKTIFILSYYFLHQYGTWDDIQFELKIGGRDTLSNW
jgi:hypothetical protein